MTKKPAKLRPDAAEIAFRVMQEATRKAPKTDPASQAKNAEAVKRGAKGGNARVLALSEKQLSDIAKKAAGKRWGKEETA